MGTVLFMLLAQQQRYRKFSCSEKWHHLQHQELREVESNFHSVLYLWTTKRQSTYCESDSTPVTIVTIKSSNIKGKCLGIQPFKRFTPLWKCFLNFLCVLIHYTITFKKIYIFFFPDLLLTRRHFHSFPIIFVRVQKSSVKYRHLGRMVKCSGIYAVKMPSKKKKRSGQTNFIYLNWFIPMYLSK